MEDAFKINKLIDRFKRRSSDGYFPNLRGIRPEMSEEDTKKQKSSRRY